MVIQVDIEGTLEKRINKLLENEYKHLNKKSFVVEMVRRQVAIEEDKKK